jgi:hypothetical protein
MERGKYRKLAVAVTLSALLTQPSYAQSLPASDGQKAAEASKKADEEATDKAYKAMMKHPEETDRTVDPWGGIRTPSATGPDPKPATPVFKTGH